VNATRRSGWSGRSLAVRLLLAQGLVVLASVGTAVAVASFVGPPLFHQHMLEAGHTPSSPELVHIEQAYIDASAVSLGVALVIALACAFAVTWYVSRRLQRPVSAMTVAAGDLARGSYAVRVPPTGAGPELDTLADSFNLMAERLERVEDTRRRLLSDLAHEMRTPLATLHVYVEGLEEGVATWDEETSRVITGQLERLTRLAEDLDDVSRAEEGRIALELEDQSVAELLAAAHEHVRAAYAAKGVRLDVDAGDPDCRTRIDRQRIGQVLGNLLSNALRHSPSGSGVTLSARPDADRVVIEVADTGDGLTAEQLPHVFERFYRGDSARDRDHGGSGIGLTISKALVEAHGGRISAQSAGPGRGSTFTVVLPGDRAAH
jgi:signal transduction histidine kinase